MGLGDIIKRTEDAAAAVRDEARPLLARSELDRVADWLGEAEIVLLGEASHGTHEFYATRAHLTRRLVERHGFSAVAIEGDWPDAYAVNRYVRGVGDARTAAEALRGFRRFPSWMWRNRDIVAWVEGLRDLNRSRPTDHRVGVYGLDLYSLQVSMRAVVDYLEQRDPAAARAARESYACFDHYGGDTDRYVWAAGQLEDGPCEDAVARQLVALHEQRSRLLRQEGQGADEAFFDAEQNARLARNAERYYRTMLSGRTMSWNVRDEHMAEALDHVRAHLAKRVRRPRVVVWAHNSHLGDARATEMAEAGELNLGQLLRERHGSAVRSVGFTTHEGTVMAASEWGGEAEVKQVRPSLAASFEDVFHRCGVPQFFLPFQGGGRAARLLNDPRLERAIGVIYRPENERGSHYFRARLTEQFDAVIHFDTTRAVEALEAVALDAEQEVPETFPSGV